MPGLVGRPEAEARRQLQELGLGVEVREERSSDAPNGVVVGQNPAPGTQVPRGRAITITIGRPQAAPKPQPKPKSKEQTFRDPVLVPRVEGLNERQARAALEREGFKVEVEEDTAPDRKGQVINQIPGPGDTAERGSAVRIFIGA